MVSQPLDVFEEEPVTIPVELTGVYRIAGTCDVVIYRGSTTQGGEVDRITVDTEWGKGEALWTPPKLDDDDAYEVFNYRITVLGLTFKPRASAVMRVWARQIELRVLDAEGQALPKARAAFSASGQQVVEADAAGLAVYTLERPGPVAVDLQSPWYVVEWVVKEGRQREVRARLGIRAVIRWPALPDGGTHRQWVNLERAEGHDDYGLQLDLRLGSHEPEPAHAGQTIWLKVVANRDNSERTPEPGQLAPCDEQVHELTLDADGNVGFTLQLGHAGGDLYQVFVGGSPETQDQSLWIETWRRLEYALVSTDLVELPEVETLSGDTGPGLPERTDQVLRDALHEVYVDFVPHSSRRGRRDEIPEHQLIPNEFAWGWAGRELWFRPGSGWQDGDPPGFGEPTTHRVNLLLFDGLLLYENAPRTLKMKLGEAELVGGRAQALIRAQVPVSYMLSGGEKVLWPRHLATGEPTITIDAGAFWKACPPEDQPDHPGWLPDTKLPQQGALTAEMVVATSFFQLEVRFPRDSVPGRLLGDVSPTTCPIQIRLQVHMASWCMGVQESGTLGSCFNEQALENNAIVLAHELGHAMGMTIMRHGFFPYPVPPGLEPPNSVDDGGLYYAQPPAGSAPGSDGYRTGHNGPHCAHGVVDKRPASYVGLSGDCIMFGAANGADPPHTYLFCSTCTRYLRAGMLVDILSPWSNRGDG